MDKAPDGLNRSISNEQIATTIGQETLARLQRLEEMQLATLEAHGREAKDRADFKRWWMKEQRRQLKTAASRLREGERNRHWNSSAAYHTAAATATAASSNLKGKSVPGKSLAKSTQLTDQAEVIQFTTEQVEATEDTERLTEQGSVP